MFKLARAPGELLLVGVALTAPARAAARRVSTSAAVVAVTVLAAPAANAASLQAVSNWGVTGLPADVSMYIYVPDRAATNPPILTLIHYCGGTASAVFGQAQGGGLVGAADQYGFIMVVPSSGRCWDVQSNKTWTRNGGGDSHAIRQMVAYAVEKYGANADRVYATGDSSGGMMTELLLALYPDVFKGGSAFAGMPAGCRGSSETGSGGGYSGACAGGSVTHTAQQWGDIVRNMDPGYAGHRPRVQLFHGDADTTIRYANFTEAIKEWTNVLGLATAPTATDTGVQLGMHQATRQRWQNACGFLVLDAFTSLGGDHGPSDALFKSTLVVPFLGLDKTGAVDPEIAQCGSGGIGGGTGADGGVDGGGRGGAGGSSGGGRGGAGGTGGAAGTTGSAGTGGTGGAGRGGSGGGGAGGGSVGEPGGRGGNGGATGSGGAQGGGGNATGGSAGESSGATGRGGAGGTGGANGMTGSGGTAIGGSPGTAGAGGGNDSGPSGCGCALASTDARERLGLVFFLAIAIVVRVRRRERPRHARGARRDDCARRRRRLPTV
ncbi:MAG TPA: PHB depolymerase family esterase [Polyangia bacterium]|jgi:poly(hydroxyalkanoate) depolymerase family esterase|nr:PHB depolymerase family esterase [Polyangia bacterium]